MTTSLPTWRTAVVVFGQAKAADRTQAMFAAERAIGQAMKASQLKGIPHSPNATHRGLWLPVSYNSPHPAGSVEVLDYLELNTAMMSGKLAMMPTLRGHE